MADPACHYCDRIAEAECATCGRLYCPDHGEDVCLRCMAPESAAPTPAIYRGSLVALGLASLVAVYLFVSPPEDEAAVDEARPVATNTPVFDATATPTVPGAGENGVGDDGEIRPTTTIATPTPDDIEDETTPTPEPDETDETTYTVQSGDTLSTIAADHGVTVDDILDANDDIDDPQSIDIGQEIIIPSP